MYVPERNKKNETLTKRRETFIYFRLKFEVEGGGMVVFFVPLVQSSTAYL